MAIDLMYSVSWINKNRNAENVTGRERKQIMGGVHITFNAHARVDLHVNRFAHAH